MTSATTKLQVGAAALATAAAASLAPMVAQADPFALAPSLTSISKAVGAAAGQGVKVVRAPGAGIQTKFIWIGTPNPAPPYPQIPVWTFKPLNAVAWIPFLAPPTPANPEGSKVWQYWSKQYSQFCIAGISTFVGPYGTTPSGTTPGVGSITRQWSPNGCKG